MNEDFHPIQLWDIHVMTCRWPNSRLVKEAMNYIWKLCWIYWGSNKMNCRSLYWLNVNTHELFRYVLALEICSFFWSTFWRKHLIAVKMYLHNYDMIMKLSLPCTICLWKIFIFDRANRRDINGSHYNDVIMGTIPSQITSLTNVYSTVYSGADQRKHQSSASLASVGEFTADRWIPRANDQ